MQREGPGLQTGCDNFVLEYSNVGNCGTLRLMDITKVIGGSRDITVNEARDQGPKM